MWPKIHFTYVSVYQQYIMEMPVSIINMHKTPRSISKIKLIKLNFPNINATFFQNNTSKLCHILYITVVGQNYIMWSIAIYKLSYTNSPKRDCPLHCQSFLIYLIYDMLWYDVVWCGVWCGVVWCDVMWSDLIWYDMIWHDTIRYDKIRCDAIRYDMLIFDMIDYLRSRIDSTDR